MNFLEAREIHFSNVLEFQKACILHKFMLDNLSRRFCIGEHCRTIWQVEIRLDGSKWGTTPKIFHSRGDAEKEAKSLELLYYPVVSKCRVITRKIEEETIG